MAMALEFVRHDTQCILSDVQAFELNRKMYILASKMFVSHRLPLHPPNLRLTQSHAKPSKIAFRRLLHILL